MINGETTGFLSTPNRRTKMATTREIFDFNYTSALAGTVLSPVTSVARVGYMMGQAARHDRLDSFKRGYQDGLKGLDLDLMGLEMPAYHVGRKMGLVAKAHANDQTSSHPRVLAGVNISEAWSRVKHLVDATRFEELTQYHGKKSESEQKKVIRRMLRKAKAH